MPNGVSAIIKVFLKAKEAIALAIVGVFIWAFGGITNNETVIQAGQWAFGVGVVLAVVLAIILKR